VPIPSAFAPSTVEGETESFDALRKPDPWAEATRRRVIVAFAAVFATSTLIVLPGVLAGVGPDPLAALVRFVLAALVLPLVLAGLARWVIRAVQSLERSREHLVDLYDLARLDSMLDPLTGLGNHRAFQEELLRQVDDSRRYGGVLALAMIDLDELKRTNDEQGHAGGDVLIRSLARLIQATTRASDRAFRIGGDEFAILLPHTDADTAHVLIRRLLASALDGHPALIGTNRLSFSAGISSFPTPSSDGGRLTRQADAALYWTKRHGRTDVHVFDPSRHGTAGDPRSIPELAAAVADVVNRRALRAVYQPIFSLTTGDVIGFEGLVRPTADSGFRDASSLFGAAEAAERIVELDHAAMETVLAGAGSLPAGCYLSVNLSPRTLEADDFLVGSIVGALSAHGLEPSRVVLELTERETIADLDRLQANLESCRGAGLRIAADDVGAGNAGLRMLTEIRFDIVKIDLSLVQRGVLHESSMAVIRAIRDLVDRWGASTVAEGVETADQLLAVQTLGISSAQGYLLARPGEAMIAEGVDLETLAAVATPRLVAKAS